MKATENGSEMFRKLNKVIVTVGLATTLSITSIVLPSHLTGQAYASTTLQAQHLGITTTGVNFRTGPSLDSSRISVVPRGTEVSILEQHSDSWYKVSVSNQVGYLSTRYVEITHTFTPVVKATVTSGVNFRTSPSTDSRVLGLLRTGSEVIILEEVNQHWVKVDYQGHEGFISTRFISIHEAEVTPPAPPSPVVPEINATVTTNVNFRSAPTVESQVLSVIRNGSEVSVLETVSDAWVKVNFQGQEGYLSARFIRYLNEAPPVVEPPQPAQPTWEQKVDAVINTGLSYLGTPYQFGARAGSGFFDCSLFTQTIYSEHGYSLPRDSRQQFSATTRINKNELRKGDLVFFYINNSSRIEHVAIYLGDDQLLHARSVGVSITRFERDSYWSVRYLGAGRVIEN